MTVLAAALGTLVVVSWLYWLVAVAAVRGVFRAPAPPAPGALPPVSVLKPLHGVDPGALENLESFCRQDYPSFELLFGVAEPLDPAVALVERLRRAWPQRSIRLVIAPAAGPNRKASLLEALAREASHDVVVTTDADMRVEPDHLRRVVAALSEPGVGLVTCPYRGEDARSLAARLEALHMGVTFLPSAVVASRLVNVAFATGATIAIRRPDLERLGGFAAVAEYLADDYQMGARTAALGLGVTVCPIAVRSVLGATTLREQWDREVRWSRCARASQPAGHYGYLLSFSTPLALSFLGAAHLAAIGWAVLSATLLLRWAAAAAIARDTGDLTSLRALPLLPVRDLMTAAVWVAGLVGRRVIWRGQAFRVDGEGKLRPERAGGSVARAPATAR
jgi:ceramide glucosyltransferase